MNWKSNPAIATVAVWLAMALIVYITKDASPIGWAVGATFIIWFFSKD